MFYIGREQKQITDASKGPWSNSIDFIEPLQWIPTRMRTRGRQLHDGLVEVYGSMIQAVKARLDAGEDVPDCLVKTLLETQEEEEMDWEDLCMLSAVFTLGGVHSVCLYHTKVFLALMKVTDVWYHCLVPCVHPVVSRHSEAGS